MYNLNDRKEATEMKARCNKNGKCNRDGLNL